MAGKSEPKKTEAVTATQLELVAGRLREFAEKLGAAAEVAKQQPEQSLAVYNWKSATRAIGLIRTFTQRVDESRDAAQLGKPVPIGQYKPRSTAKPKSTAEVDAIIEDHRKTVKKTKKKP
jgi:hypothetical protein